MPKEICVSVIEISFKTLQNDETTLVTYTAEQSANRLAMQMPENL